MTAKVKCPVCNARNQLTATLLLCRRCQEDLFLLYLAKGHSYKFRLQLAQMLQHPDLNAKKQLAQAAAHFSK